MRVKLTVAGHEDKLVAKAVVLLRSRWNDRTRVKLGATGDWELSISLEPGMPRQAYAFATAGKTVTLRGADGHGVLYGVGQLLRTLVFEPTRVAMPKLNVTRTPAVYDRGVYFATHFNNFYEAAPIEHVESYIEEMALWGFDGWMFWFDMNWFPHGFWCDPRSRGSKMIARLNRMIETARACGMKVATGAVGNEGFHYQPPVELLADPRARHGAFYQYSQICPAKPAGLALILENRRQVMKLLSPFDVLIHWPYDPGGCGCAECAARPERWGKKFLELGQQVAAVARESNPKLEVVVSTWLMDEAERKLVYALCDARADWFQGLMSHADHIAEYSPPAAYSRFVFPEISMFDCYFCSYGCNGANPAPQRMAAEAQRVARAGWGTQLYSEGIYTDANAAVYAARLWDPDCDVAGILADYSRYYFGQANVLDAMDLLVGLETTWGAKALLQANPKTVARLLRKARALKRRLPRYRDARDRWQLLHDRAAMDQLMKVAGPDHALVVESRELFEASGYQPAGQLRSRVRRFVGELRRRKKIVDELMAVHWRYLQYFHMQRNVLVFLPDDVLGRQQWDPLIAPLTKAVVIRDSNRFRDAINYAFKRWFWSNGIDFDYYAKK
ncbi:MAG: hypothetical protein PCFJNLEI_00048 [Verrucomicrobiae bacterium]|nr:hypothetical protein [Verrucomicrobiae bacterium]